MNRKNIWRIIILIIAAGLIISGLLGGDNNNVFQKAIHICYECIGLG